MKEVFLVQSAEADLQRAYNYFENQEEGLGETFYEAVQAALARISEFPELAPIYEDGIRRLLV